jgi:hypothetical protein
MALGHAALGHAALGHHGRPPALPAPTRAQPRAHAHRHTHTATYKPRFPGGWPCGPPRWATRRRRRAPSRTPAAPPPQRVAASPSWEGAAGPVGLRLTVCHLVDLPSLALRKVAMSEWQRGHHRVQPQRWAGAAVHAYVRQSRPKSTAAHETQYVRQLHSAATVALRPEERIRGRSQSRLGLAFRTPHFLCMSSAVPARSPHCFCSTVRSPSA